MVKASLTGTARLGVYLFTDDLRLHDNTALIKAASLCDQLICLYCANPADHRAGPFGFRAVGKHRWRFIRQSIAQLDENLRKHNQRLIMRLDSTVNTLATLIEKYQVDDIFVCRIKDPKLALEFSELKEAYPTVAIHQIDSNSLLSKSQLPFELNAGSFPKTFSQFNKAVDSVSIFSPRKKLQRLPCAPEDIVSDYSLSLSQAEMGRSFIGGEHTGIKHLSDYFHSQLPESYLETRNHLKGWNDSTKLSPWLSTGCLSPRTIYEALSAYQLEHGHSKSNQWILYELYWREYFHWYAQTHKNNLHRFSGISTRKPLTSYYPERLAKWCEGNTPYPLVNACMKQLTKTGFMSNRGRQIAASCLVNELSVDWRYGAAYFQEMLIDHDIGSNWGNWQYIAGVGSDPRGGRHFNIHKQSAAYDPDNEFTEAWCGNNITVVPLDSVDMVDWPVVFEQQKY